LWQIWQVIAIYRTSWKNLFEQSQNKSILAPKPPFRKEFFKKNDEKREITQFLSGFLKGLACESNQYQLQ
jgi:hypothetical protein